MRSINAVKEPPAFSRRSEISIVVRPEINVPVPIHVYTFIEKGNDLKPWHAPFERSAAGTIRIKGSARTLLPKDSGHYVLVFVITREQNIFTDPQHARRVARGEWASSRDWRVIRVPVQVR